MADPAQLETQADRLAVAKQRQADREKGIHANAFKQGRAAERAEHETEKARLQGQHQGELKGQADTLRAESARVSKAHEKGAFWFGAVMGAACGAIFASAGYLLVVDRAMNQAFDRAQEIAAASTLVGAATQRRDEAQGH